LPKREEIVAFANWPFHAPVWLRVESKFSAEQREVLDAEFRAELKQLSRQDFLRFLEKGKKFAFADSFPERSAEAPWVCIEGVAFTKGGSPLFWAMNNARTLHAWDIKRRSLFLVLDIACIPQRSNIRTGMLKPPRADEVAGFCNAAPASYRWRLELDLVARETLVDFLSRGKAFPNKSHQPYPIEFWRAGGACLAVDSIYFFDQWDEQTVFLERQDGASCVLVKAKADKSNQTATESQQGAESDGQRTKRPLLQQKQ